MAADALKVMRLSPSMRQGQNRPDPTTSPNSNPVNVYEKVDSQGFKLIGSFISARRAGQFLGMSGSAIIKYMHSGEVYNERYKLSSQTAK